MRSVASVRVELYDVFAEMLYSSEDPGPIRNLCRPDLLGALLAALAATAAAVRSLGGSVGLHWPARNHCNSTKFNAHQIISQL